jgi:hypothetical protein
MPTPTAQKPNKPVTLDINAQRQPDNTVGHFRLAEIFTPGI